LEFGSDEGPAGERAFQRRKTADENTCHVFRDVRENSVQSLGPVGSVLESVSRARVGNLWSTRVNR
jgi:hypothetical protein